jgi:Protein of unknown function (DUF3300)
MIMKVFRQILAVYFSSWLLLAPAAINASQTEQAAAQSQPQVVTQPPEELQQMVAPIALYPDALVSQILAGATYPTEIVEADRWVQDHQNLKGKDLANAVDQQPWDPSIKALSQFPSVLANMDKNLSWTSALGEAYVNQSEAVMAAVQVMRARAQASGNLKSNEQVKVQSEEKTIVIEPANPQVVYVPAYDPWIVYGTPVVVWSGWYPYPGLYVAGPGVSFGVGFSVGFVAGFAWGWHGWGCNWGGGTVVYNHNTFVSNSQTFYGGHGGYQGYRDYGAARGYQGYNNGQRRYAGVNNSGAERSYEASRGSGVERGDAGSHGGYGRGGSDGSASEHASSQPHTEDNAHSGAFAGYGHGGTTRSYSDRGASSLHSGSSHGSSGFHGGGFGGHH